MKVALWLLALFALAVALALFAGNNQGTVTLFWPPWRVDLSVNLALLLLVGLFVLLHMVLRSLSALWALPADARAWRQRQKERAMHAAFEDAIVNLMAGRFVRARRAALDALERERALLDEPGPSGAPGAMRNARLRALAHLLVAESAHALQDPGQRDQQMQLALQAAQHDAADVADSVRMRAARWLIDDRDPQAALAALAQMPQGAARRTLALRLRLKASRLARRSHDALDTARLLAKHRAFSADVAQTILRGLAVDLLSAAHDPAQLQRAWQSLEPRERELPDVAVHGALRLLALQGEPAQARQWLLPAWERYRELPDSVRGRLVRALEAAMAEPDAAWLARVEQAQAAQPRDAALQYLAGMACMRMQLWGKARQHLTQATMGLHDTGLLRSAWRGLAELAEQRGDADAAAQAWRRAATL